MNADRLLRHYEAIADAPDAVPRLRRFVLDLAVRGKLVPQEAGDEPAWESLKTKNLPFSHRGPFAIPESWAWAEVRVIAETRLGKMLDKAKNKGEPRLYIRNINVRWFEFDLSNLLQMPFENDELSEFELRSGDVLVCEGGEPGRAAVWDARISSVFFQKAIHRIRFISFINPFFFVINLKASADDGRLAELFTGSGIKHLTGKGLGGYQLPIPPFAEQQRIVAKVDELMVLCDRLEAMRARRENARDRTTAASLARLNAPDPETFQADVRFTLDALPALTKRPDQLKAVRQNILDLAVRGKLVASKNAKAASVDDHRTLQNGYVFKSDWFSESGVRLLRNANIGHDEIHWHDTVHLPSSRFDEFERFHLNEGDIVLTLDRPFIATGTKVARISASDLPSLLLQRVGRFVEVSPGLDDRYLFLWINSPHFNEQIDPGRSNGVPHISSKQVEAANILVPPLAEQHRIVAKVDALMALCDRLEASLAAAESARARLLDALLAEALSGAEAPLPAAAE